MGKINFRTKYKTGGAYELPEIWVNDERADLIRAIHLLYQKVNELEDRLDKLKPTNSKEGGE